MQSVALNPRQGVYGLRHKERVGGIGAQLAFPNIQFEVLGSLYQIGCLGRGDNLSLGESLVDDVEAEVEVRVVVGHEDVLQVLLQCLDLPDQFLGILLLELRVDERGIFLAIDDGGSDGENGIGSWVVDLERQALGIAAHDDGHENNCQCESFHIHFYV